MEKNSVPFRYRDGVLVKPENKNTVYWVAGRYKMPIRSMAVFEAHKFEWSNVIVAEIVIVAETPGGTNSNIPGVSVLDTPHPIYPNKLMYQNGTALSAPNPNLIARSWKNSDKPAVSFNAYFASGYKKLNFTCRQVYENRFSWDELVVF